MTALRNHCIDRLSPLLSYAPVTEKIMYARECIVVYWLIDAYNELAQRQATLTKEEISIIGSECAIGLLRVREQWLINLEKQNTNAISFMYTPSERKKYDHRPTIKLIFHEEITALEGRLSDLDKQSVLRAT
jgi:hypothetical protein